MSDDFGLWDVFLSMFWFMLLITWIWMIITIFGDIFRDRTTQRWREGPVEVFLIFLPWIGALSYLIARGGSMHERSAQAAKENEEHFRAYVQNAASTTSAADELKKLAELRDSGVITPADYEQAKAKVLA